MKNRIVIILISAIFFVPFIGNVHLFDWDEINFAELSREMLVLNDYLNVHINYQSFWEKPPLFMWFQAISMNIFGVNEFAARLPNAICGIFTLVFIFNIGQRIVNTRFGIIWTLAYLGSIFPFLFFKSGIIDPWFNFFIFGGIYYFILAYWKKDKMSEIVLTKNKWFYFVISGLFIGLGILTKGPVAFLIAALTFFVYWCFQRFRMYVNVANFLVFTIAALSITGFWFGVEVWKNGFSFVEEFVVYQIRLFSTPDAGHGGFMGYHFVVLLVGCFPASIFAIRSFFKLPKFQSDYQNDFTLWAKILFWVVLILFTIVKTKIVHYSSLCYFPLTYLAALVIDKIINKEIVFNKWMKFGLLSIGGVFILAIFAAPFVGMNIEMLKSLTAKDAFATANLDAVINWTGIEIIPSIFLLGIIITFLRLLKQKSFRAFQVLFIGNAVFCMLTLGFFIAKIEAISQNAAISFYESKIEEDCVIYTYGYKSYAHLFYAQKRTTNRENHVEQILLKRDAVNSLGRVTNIDAFNDLPNKQSIYIVCKIQKAVELRAIDWLEEVENKNGFVFFKRNDK
jgi:4-amino-4-deoxy-L-arabinose transferase-like glycosyltransferase